MGTRHMVKSRAGLVYLESFVSLAERGQACVVLVRVPARATCVRVRSGVGVCMRVRMGVHVHGGALGQHVLAGTRTLLLLAPALKTSARQDCRLRWRARSRTR